MQPGFPFHQLATTVELCGSVTNARSVSVQRFSLAGGLLVSYRPERFVLADVFIIRQ
jgi:hypothetical protein